MLIVGKVYKVRSHAAIRTFFPVWETKLFFAHASKHQIKYIEDGTKMICLGYELVGSPEKLVTKLLIDGVIWYTYLDPIAETTHLEEL